MDEFTKAMFYPTDEDIRHWKEAHEKIKETILSIEEIPGGFRVETTLDLTFLSI